MLKKIYNISLASTSIFVFLTWNFTARIDPNIFQNTATHITVTTTINLVLAYGFFHALANIIIYFSNKSTYIKKLILGSSYIEGIWIGYSISSLEGNDSLRYIVKEINQDMENIVITARSYDMHLELRTTAVSKIALIYMEKRSLIFITESRRYKGILLGGVCAELQLINKGRSTPPERMSGTTTYLEDGSVRKNMFKKLSNLPHKFEYWEPIQEAQKFHKDSFEMAKEIIDMNREVSDVE
jgi:hypothetical protein